LTIPSADVSVTQNPSFATVSVGTPLAYFLAIQNSGPWTATGVVLSNPVPTGVDFVSASSSQGTCVFTNGCVLCSLGSLVYGAVATVTINTTATQAGSVTNFAVVTQNESDPVPANNTNTAVVAVNAEPGVFVGDAVATQGANPGSISFVITLSAASSAAISVSYQTSDGTAVAGEDYTATSGVVIFNPGSASRQVSVPIIRGGASAAPEKYFFLDLASATNATLARSHGVGTIAQQDFYGISITGSVVETKFGASNATFQVALSLPSPKPVSVVYQTVDGSAIAGADYAPRAGTLDFAPGVTNLAINVPVLRGPATGVIKNFYVVLSQAENAVLGVNQAQATYIGDALAGPLSITGVQLQGTNILIQFQSIYYRQYRLERSDDLQSGVWTIVADQIPGTGAGLALADPVAISASTRFYRLVLLP
jgi:chitinase